MNNYDTFEVHPCVILNESGNLAGVVHEQCDETDPNIALWTVYGHIQNKGLEAVSDHLTKQRANAALSYLQKGNLIEPIIDSLAVRGIEATRESDAEFSVNLWSFRIQNDLWIAIYSTPDSQEFMPSVKLLADSAPIVVSEFVIATLKDAEQIRSDYRLNIDNAVGEAIRFLEKQRGKPITAADALSIDFNQIVSGIGAPDVLTNELMDEARAAFWVILLKTEMKKDEIRRPAEKDGHSR